MTKTKPVITVLALGFLTSASGFVNPKSSFTKSPQLNTLGGGNGITTTNLNLLPLADASFLTAESASGIMDAVSSSLDSSNLLMSFTDQGQNLAGIFFQASLLPYLLFLYFLSFRANRIPGLANFGFQAVILFVISTIPSGIISKSVYGTSLANVDWLHGGAEALLTLSNILIVLGLKEASSNENPSDNLGAGRAAVFGAFGLFALCAAFGPSIGFEAHSPFLFGLGDLPQDLAASLPWVSHAEPINGLSIPTWTIHYSSVFEYLFAMNLVWKFAEVTENEKWKGMTWGMLPLHASGVCACTYHFFYNPSALQYLVTAQAGLTLLGNITCMIAAFRIARSNGWNIEEVNPFKPSGTSPKGLVADALAATPLQVTEAKESNQVLLAKLAAITVVASYVTKYGELGLDIPFDPSVPISLAMILGFPAVTAYYYANQSKSSENDSSIFSNLPSFGGDKEEGGGLSMADVKKYGVAGTVAYVLTELAFWIVAFPVAGYALYESTGHWPDVINEPNDRAAVLAFIFAGANIARAFVPVRLGAALALAPWVDDNILSNFGDNNDDSDDNGSGIIAPPKGNNVVVEAEIEEKKKSFFSK